jgi:cytochrome c oxidase accessory protein FixG
VSTSVVPRPQGRILPTMNEDGSRRWIRPKPSGGAWYRRRQVVAYALMVVYLAIPHLHMNGKPLMLLDAPRREFTLFGYTFLSTDTLLLMLLLGTLTLLVFTFTAVFGRVWCGWGCPQTVWMEFLFRPIERWVEGGRSASLLIDKSGRHGNPRRLAKFVIYAVLSLILAHTFLAYFVGVEQLEVWVRRSPVEHPSSFAVMAITSILVFLDFSYFREQTCTIACPYGRWQSVLLDKNSLVVAYDYGRGEPREKGKLRSPNAGDCIDCGACVVTCPTGIDIRDGLQMECIHCTQCADACDSIMQAIGKPPGLVRCTSREILAGAKKHIVRPRTVLYPIALVIVAGTLAYQLEHKEKADIILLRSLETPFTENGDGTVSNQLRLRITNRSGADQRYRIEVAGARGGNVIIPVNPFPVGKGRTETVSLFIVLPQHAFIHGTRPITLHIADGDDFDGDFPFRLLGPQRETESERAERANGAEERSGASIRHPESAR